MDNATGHPEQKLLFFVEKEIGDSLLAAVPSLIARLALARSWTLRPPEFVDMTDSSAATRSGDLPVRTFGGVLSLYAPRDRQGMPLPKDVDRGLLEDVKHLMAELARFSKDHRLQWGVELGGEYIGRVAKGRLDENLRIGLIEEWERVLSGP